MADPYIYNITDTWNDAGTPFFAISMDVTNTASHADSRVQRWRVGGADIASLTPAGKLILVSDNSGGVQLEFNCAIDSFQVRGLDAWGMVFGKNGSACASIPSNAANAPISINYTYGNGQIVWATGIASAGEVGIGRSAAGVLKITDGSTGDGALELSYVRTKPLTVVTLPVAATAGDGARAFVTDALTPVYGSTVVGGGAVKTPVYSDGTNWIVG